MEFSTLSSGPFNYDVAQAPTALEAVFGRRFFEDTEELHPLVRLHALLSNWHGSKTFDRKSPKVFGQDFAKAFQSHFDVLALTKCWGEHYGDFSGIDPTRFGGEQGAVETVANLMSSEQYIPQMLELWAAAQFTTVSHTASKVTDPGMPDLLLRHTASDSPSCFVECKHLSSFQYDAVIRCMKKANKQLRNGARTHAIPGVLVVGLLENDATKPSAFSELGKRQIATASSAVLNRLLSGYFKSVSRVYLVWDEVVLADRPVDYVCQATAYRTFLSIDNPNANRPCNYTCPYLQPSCTTFNLNPPSFSGISHINFPKAWPPATDLKSPTYQRFKYVFDSLTSAYGQRLSPTRELVFASATRLAGDSRLVDLLVLERADGTLHVHWGATLELDRFPGLITEHPFDLFRSLLDVHGRRIVFPDRRVNVADRYAYLSKITKDDRLLHPGLEGDPTRGDTADDLFSHAEVLRVADHSDVARLPDEGRWLLVMNKLSFVMPQTLRGEPWFHDLGYRGPV